MDTGYKHRIAVAILWVLLLIAFLWHTILALMPLFYGITVAHAELASQDPDGGKWMMLGFGMAFITFAGLAALIQNKIYRWINFGFAALATLANLAHLAEHAFAGNVGIIDLIFLVFTLALSITLAIVSFQWARAK